MSRVPRARIGQAKKGNAKKKKDQNAQRTRSKEQHQGHVNHLAQTTENAQGQQIVIQALTGHVARVTHDEARVGLEVQSAMNLPESRPKRNTARKTNAGVRATLEAEESEMEVDSDESASGAQADECKRVTFIEPHSDAMDIRDQQAGASGNDSLPESEFDEGLTFDHPQAISTPARRSRQSHNNEESFSPDEAEDWYDDPSLVLLPSRDDREYFLRQPGRKASNCMWLYITNVARMKVPAPAPTLAPAPIIPLFVTISLINVMSKARKKPRREQSITKLDIDSFSKLRTFVLATLSCANAEEISDFEYRLWPADVRHELKTADDFESLWLQAIPQRETKTKKQVTIMIDSLAAEEQSKVNQARVGAYKNVPRTCSPVIL
ncbi:hypothetical protein BKA62DRAFT_770554 [Auriculariales sp. MPI-PUGE-AT-0066]|nr:hypothetical protein BKA62DRAFT_770554 [Auriculariales sp. MPI-PUGE-AT-0066]